MMKFKYIKRTAEEKRRRKTHVSRLSLYLLSLTLVGRSLCHSQKCSNFVCSFSVEILRVAKEKTQVVLLSTNQKYVEVKERYNFESQ